METRTHLRTRVFAVTAAGVILLLGVTATLTWRTRTIERRFASLVVRDLAAERELSELSRSARIIEARVRVHENDDSFGDVSADWQLIGNTSSAPLTEAGEPDVVERLEALGRRIVAIENDWSSMDGSERARVRDDLAADLQRFSNSTRARAGQRSESARVALAGLSRNAANTIWVALGLAWIVALAAFAIARKLVDKVIRPVEDLSAAAEALAAGRLDARAPVRGDAEIANLGKSFNEMARALEASHKALSERAQTDELTGLPNFRTFNQALEAEIERAQRFEYAFGLLIIDVDHFKRYNDEYGHQAGNEALRLVSRILTDTTRSIDVPARYGGEEFAVIVPRADTTGLVATAERIRSTIERAPGIEKRKAITVSVGGAMYPVDGEKAGELFERADERLYEAKHGGRNRSVLPSLSSLVPHRRKGSSLRRA